MEIQVTDWKRFLAKADAHFGDIEAENGASVTVCEADGHRRAHVIYEARHDGYRGLFYRML